MHEVHPELFREKKCHSVWRSLLTTICTFLCSCRFELGPHYWPGKCSRRIRLAEGLTECIPKMWWHGMEGEESLWTQFISNVLKSACTHKHAIHIQARRFCQSCWRARGVSVRANCSFDSSSSSIQKRRLSRDENEILSKSPRSKNYTMTRNLVVVLSKTFLLTILRERKISCHIDII